MNYSEDELIQISLLQHYVFCPRRAALVMLEQIWQDNLFTVEGSINHEYVHSLNAEKRSDIRYVTALDLFSQEFGLIGKADMVEFHRTDDGSGVTLNGLEGKWEPIIIEYKRGMTKDSKEFQVQLCGQALCMEEMYNCHINCSYLYYAGSKRRTEIELNSSLRQKTTEVIKNVRNMLISKVTPKPEFMPKCNGCSLFDVCLPKIAGKKSAEAYINNLLKHGV